MQKGTKWIIALLAVLIICVIAALAVLMLDMYGIIGNDGKETQKSDTTQTLLIPDSDTSASGDTQNNENTGAITAPPSAETTADQNVETTARPMPETTSNAVPETTAKPAPETTAKPAPETTTKPTPDTTAQQTHTHSWSSWKTLKEATCTEVGNQERSCACGEKETQTIKAKGHSAGNWITDKAATCTTGGSRHQICSICGVTIKTEAISATGHKASAWVTDKAATCTTDGSRHQACSVCGATTKTENVKASGHKEGNWIVDKAATCTLNGSRHKVCTACGITTKTENISATGHSFGSWVVTTAATCTNNGTQTRSCTCGAKETKTIAMIAHTYGAWTVTKAATCTEDGSQKRTCKCGKSETAKITKLEHNYVDDVCTLCGSINYNISDEFLIKNADDLKKLSNSKDTFMLANDIDLAGINWTPIEGFSGTLIGNGCKIKNLTINSTESYVGMFSTLEGKVSDIIFENANVTITGNQKYIGILCGRLLEGEFSDITVFGNVTAKDSQWVGGIVGAADIFRDCTLQNAENHANVIGESYVGGVAGWMGGETNANYSTTTLTLKSFSNKGTIIGISEYVGGIFGCLDSYYNSSSQIIKLYDAENTGDVSGKTDVGGIVGMVTSKNSASVIDGAVCNANIIAEAKVGCIVGRALLVTLDNCSNNGSTLTATKYIVDDGEKYAYVGGIAGIAYLVNNSANYVNINYTAKGYYVGGIAGFIYGIATGDIENLENYGDITGYENVGGIAGTCYYIDEKDSNEHHITGLENYGTIKSTNGWVGGVIGVLQCYKNQLNDIHNFGDVIGTEHVGGILGYGESESRDCCLIDATCKADITGTAYVGCIAGQLLDISIDSCSNEGSTLTATKYVTVDGIKYAYVGGLVGYGYGASDCTNSVDINYTGGGRYVGGIMGLSTGCYLNQTLYYDTLTNEGQIKGSDYVGGVFGAVIFTEDDWYFTNKYTFVDMKNTANVTGTGNYVGGIFGYFIVELEGGNGWVYITDANNSGNISGKEYVGGIVGLLKKSGNSSFHGTGNASGIFDPVSTGKVVGTAHYGDIFGESDISVK